MAGDVWTGISDDFSFVSSLSSLPLFASASTTSYDFLAAGADTDAEPWPLAASSLSVSDPATLSSTSESAFSTPFEPAQDAFDAVDWDAFLSLPTSSLDSSCYSMPSAVAPAVPLAVSPPDDISPYHASAMKDDSLNVFPFLDAPASTTPSSSSSAPVSAACSTPASTAPDALLPGLTCPQPKPQAPPDITVKRQRNNLAARKYRQKKIDRISELEAEVGQLQQERDTLRIQLARQEAETAALREMLLGDRGGKRKRTR